MKQLESSINDLLDRIKNKDDVSNGDLVFGLKNIFCLLDETDHNSRNLALSGICHISDYNPEDCMVQALLNECIIKSRIFLYRDMLQTININFLNNNPIKPTASLVKNYYTNRVTGCTLTREQKIVLSEFSKTKRVVLSAPTSFGKTKLLEEIIISSNYKNIAIIVPTNSLLSENYHRLKNIDVISKKYLVTSSYRILNKANLDSPTIYVLTPEKLLNLLDEYDIKFDFFVFDEFYKISKEFDSDEKGDFDKRYKVFEYSLYRLLQNTNIHFYLTGPYINNFSKNFLDKEKAIFIEFKTEIVQKQIYLGFNEISSTLNLKLTKDKNVNSRKAVAELNKRRQQTLVYTGNKKSAERLALVFVNKNIANSGGVVQERLSEFINYIKNNIDENWNLVTALKGGVAFHHGAIPRYIQTEIVDLFNLRIINTLCCTSTLAEGVNTSAKNVIVYETKKGKNKLCNFDRKNIEGRSGRFMQHFIGNVYYLDEDTINDCENNVEFEYYDLDSLPDEDIILIEDKDLREKSNNRLSELRLRLDSLGIDEKVIKSNRFVDIEAQIEIIQILRIENGYKFKNISKGFPTNEELDYIFSKIIILMGIKGKYLDQLSLAQWRWLVASYMKKPYFKTILNHEIVTDYSSNINTRIRYSFSILSKYFEFIFPKYLKAFQVLYNYVAIENGYEQIDLGRIIGLLEYGSSDEVEILLKESGLPLEIIKKIKKYFDNCRDLEEISSRFSKIKSELSNNLTVFEFNLLNKYL